MSEFSEHVNDLWEDMDRLNAMYEELMWDNDDVLEFVADYKNIELLLQIEHKILYKLRHCAINIVVARCFYEW